ncbi:MAG: hypothetical protein ABFD60_06560 [Bryobacteraceae bacterium]
MTWCGVVFVAGLLVRLALLWVASGPETRIGGEPISIARSLAATGAYADAYGAGVGPTAHCAPLHPLLVSVLFRLFGTGQAGSLVVAAFGCMAAAMAFAFLPALAVAGQLSRRAGVLAGMAGALLPVNYWSQTSGSFDAPYTALALAALFFLLCRSCQAGQFAKSEALQFGAVAGLACLLNPVLSTVLTAWAVTCLVRRRSQWRPILAFFAIVSLCVVCILAPWSLRNYLALGSPIWTRSNFGLELQVSNNDILTADLERNVRDPQFGLLHPFRGAGERAKVHAMGEVAYQRSKLRQAISWITGHKARFLRLTVERFRLFWLPNMRRPWQAVFEAALTISGLCGLALLFYRRHAFAWVAATALFAYPAVYYIIQVSPRYRFPLEPLLFLLSTYAAMEVTRMIAARGSTNSRAAGGRLSKATKA